MKTLDYIAKITSVDDEGNFDEVDDFVLCWMKNIKSVKVGTS